MRRSSAERPAAQTGPQASHLGGSLDPRRIKEPPRPMSALRPMRPLGHLVPHIFSMKTERPIPGGQGLIDLEVYTEVSIEDFSSERPQALYLIEVFSMSTERPGVLPPCASAQLVKHVSSK